MININYKSTKVLKIIEDVKRNGDRALIKYEKNKTSCAVIPCTNSTYKLDKWANQICGVV